MKTRELINLGFPQGPIIKRVRRAAAEALQRGLDKKALREFLKQIAKDPVRYEDDSYFGDVARALAKLDRAQKTFVPRKEPATFHQWGKDLDANSLEQMHNACALPVSVRGALMADAHVGYGLPIGGVLATRNAIIPYAVGVDIACRMKLSVYDMPVKALDTRRDKLIDTLVKETRFGIGSHFKNRRHHDVLDEDWSVSPVTRALKDKAWAQLGTSGSGNHFVEYGVLSLEESALGLEAGEYLALLSHSGSRGTGASVCNRYSGIAREKHGELPRELGHLAWLDMDTSEGREYWDAMELMGKYAAANHACIHRHIAQALGVQVIADVENHHNFAWKERHDGEELVVHRKGATPAGEGMLGVIPGTMASPAYVVAGKGNGNSLNSAAHGAGRVMSRKRAKRELNWHYARKVLEERGVELLSAGLDEVPMVYKDIDAVMAAQADLVTVLARFDPKIVKMAPSGERPED